MILALIFYLILVFAVPVGYAVYRARRIAIIERMGRQLHLETMPLTSDNPLLNRPLNPDLDITYSKFGTFTRDIPGTPALRYAPIGRYIPDSDTWEPAPYVKDEFEDRAGEMLQVEML